jgi:hypothetical protein
MVALLRDEGHDVLAVADVMPEAVREYPGLCGQAGSHCRDKRQGFWRVSLS